MNHGLPHPVDAQPGGYVAARLRTAVRQLPYYLRTLRLIWGAARGLTVAWAALLLAQGLLPVASVYLTKRLVDGLVGAIGSGYSWPQVQPVVLTATFMGGVLLLGELARAGMDWVRTAQAEYVQDHITEMIQGQSATVDLAFYESPEYFDHLDRARSDGSSRSLALLEGTGSVIQSSVTLLAMAVVLVQYTPWLPVILIIGTLPALYVVLRSNVRYHQWWRQTTSDRRWVQYFDFLLTHNTVATELRLFGLREYVQSRYQSVRRRLRAQRLALLTDQGFVRLAAGLFALLAMAGALAWMARGALLGLLTLGDLALFYQAYSRGQDLLHALLGSLGSLYANSLFLSDLFEFLQLKPQVVDPVEPSPIPMPLQDGIRFQRVTFRYPLTARPVLDGLDLEIPAGRITAIVGENGAGKSTLVKLLCRFYDPNQGSVTIDGIDLRQFSASALRRRITVMFQLPVPYVATAAENISMGDSPAELDRGAIEQAAQGAGADRIIEHLPHGYDTLLGRLFPDGAELSVGEWQRIALARAFRRRADILILDEPTSFMDPWAEIDWMARFHTLAKGRTAVIITHRFTTARHADLIYVVKDGRVVEHGSHAALLALGGRYATSWNAQMLGVEADRPASAPAYVSA